LMHDDIHRWRGRGNDTPLPWGSTCRLVDINEVSRATMEICG
jgi:hypothetical protein